MSRNLSIGFTVDTYKNLTPSQIIKALNYLGVEFVEISRSVFGDLPGVARRLGSMRTAFHLPLIHDDGWDLSCVDFAKEIKEFIIALNAAKSVLNIQHIIAHPPEPYLSDGPATTSTDFLFTNLSKIELPIYFENVSGMSPNDHVTLLHRAQTVLGRQVHGLCLDMPHLYIDGYDPLQIFLQQQPKIGCLHLSDCNAHQDLHLPFGGEGHLPIKKILETIRRAHFSGYITLEIKPQSLQDLRAFIQSYLLVLRYLNLKKYLITQIGYTLFFSIVKRMIG